MSAVAIEDEAFRGDTLEFEVNVKRDGTPVDFASCPLWCTGKKRRTDPEESAVFQVTHVSSAMGWIRQPYGQTGKLLVTLTPVATWPLRGLIQIDVQFLDPVDESEWTVASGEINFLLDVTRTTLTPLPPPLPNFTARDAALREYVQEIMIELDPGGVPPA